jgi:hypothetical protein
MRRKSNSLAAVMLALVGHASAADAPTVDVDFLEFLGSDDSDDEDWDALLTASTDDAKTQKPDDRKPAQPAKTRPAGAKEGES